MRFQRVKNVAWRRMGDETVIVNLGRRRMLAVNKAGGDLWDRLAAAAAVAPADAAYVADLEAEGVVEQVEGDEPGAPSPGSAAGAPAVLWRETLSHFGGACALMPAESETCNGGGTQFS
jgi:hypothetical protein